MDLNHFITISKKLESFFFEAYNKFIYGMVDCFQKHFYSTETFKTYFQDYVIEMIMASW